MFGLDVGFIAAASMKSDGKLSESAARDLSRIHPQGAAVVTIACRHSESKRQGFNCV
jgi:hypothetical protein